MKYNLKPCERETYIYISSDSNVAKVTTLDQRYITKLDKLTKECSDNYRLLKKEDWLGNTYAEYSVEPKKLIAFRKPRALSEEQKQAMSERMRGVALERAKVLEDVQD